MDLRPWHYAPCPQCGRLILKSDPEDMRVCVTCTMAPAWERLVDAVGLRRLPVPQIVVERPVLADLQS